MSFSLGALLILYITILLCRYSYWLGMKKGMELKEKIPYHNYPVFHQIEKED